MSEFNELNEILAKEKPRTSHTSKGVPAQNSRDYIEYGEEDEDEIEGLEKSYVQWTSHNGRIYTPAAKTKKKLTPGVYEIDSNPNVGLYGLVLAVQVFLEHLDLPVDGGGHVGP
jgi:hypothetical protein